MHFPCYNLRSVSFCPVVLALLTCFKYAKLFHYRLRQALQSERNLVGNGVAASGFIYNGHDLCCHPEFYRKFRLKQIRGKRLIREYTSALFPECLLSLVFIIFEPKESLSYFWLYYQCFIN